MRGSGRVTSHMEEGQPTIILGFTLRATLIKVNQTQKTVF